MTTFETVLLVVGFVVGALAAGLFVKQKWERVYEDMYLLSALGQVDVARQIREGTSAMLLGRIESALPFYVEGIDSTFVRSERTRVAMAALQVYMVEYSLPVTPKAQRVFDSL